MATTSVPALKTPVKKAPAKRVATKKAPVEITSAHAKDIKAITLALKKYVDSEDPSSEFFSSIRELNKKLASPLNVEPPSKTGEVSLTICLNGDWKFVGKDGYWGDNWELPTEVMDSIERALAAVPGVTSADVYVDSVVVE